MAAYIDSKSRQLNLVLAGFFQEDMTVWPQAPPPTQLRDTCLEVLFSLVSCIAALPGALQTAYVQHIQKWIKCRMRHAVFLSGMALRVHAHWMPLDLVRQPELDGQSMSLECIHC